MRFLLVTLLILSCLKNEAQTFTVYNYSVPEGLPSSEVYEIHQDRKGFLWFATDNGVVKFDGSQMITYHTKDGLSDPVVFGFHEDTKDRLWFRTFSGKLSYYENGKIKKYPYNELLTKFKFTGLINIAISNNDDVWFTLRHILGKIDSTGSLTVTSMKDKGFFYKTIDNSFITGIADRRAPMDTITVEDKTFAVNAEKVIHNNIVYSAVTWHNKLYLATRQEVFAFDGDTLTRVFSGKHPIINLSKDNEDNLWIGYLNGGVTRFIDENFQENLSPLFLKGKSVTKVLQDHEGGYWFSTLENGVFHVPNLFISHFPASSSRIRGVIYHKGNVITGDYAGNLTGFDGKTKAMLWKKPVVHPVVSLFTNKKNKIWLSGNGIDVYSAELKLEKNHFALANHFFEDTHGNVWSFGSNRLRKYDEDGNLLADSVVRMIVARSFYLDDSLVFLADRTGLKVLNKDLKMIKSPEDFADLKISNIRKLNDSTLLITTLGRGFILLNRNTWGYQIYNTDNSFLSDYIYSSLVTDSTIWLGTEKGLIKIRVDRLFRSPLSFEYLTKKSGLINDKIDFIVPVNNAIWAFTDNYFSVIPLTFSKFAHRKPLFYIESIEINDRVINFSDHISLSHEKNNIAITYSFISFNNPNIKLRYRLSSNENWIYTGNKKLAFSSVAPGSYSFDLQFSTDNIKWEPALPGLNFIIKPPWWNRWYIQLLAFSLFLVLIYWYFKYQRSIYNQRNQYFKIINEHQHKLLQSEIVTRERERNRISKELHDRVGTNLTAIKLTVSQLLKHHREPLAADIEDQFQIAIKEIKDIIYDLAPPVLERYGLFTGLRNYIGKLTKTIPINIALKTYGKDIHSYDLNIMVFRVLQELISNTIKHSFAKNITIHINSFEDVLNIVYEDDGIGFSYNPEQSGLGLDNIESRIQSINGTLKFESGNFGISYTIDIPITLNKEVV